jgi:hypothetical protein
MNMRENRWLIVKIILLGWLAITDSGAFPKTTGEQPPFWAFGIIPFIFFAGFLPMYLKRFPKTRTNASSSVWKASPLHFFTAPLPFYHLCAWAGLTDGVGMYINNILHPGVSEMSVIWFSLAAGSGCYVGVWLTLKSIHAKNQ